MKKSSTSSNPAWHAVEVWQPQPEVLYSLDAMVHLAGATRHSILIYCRAGLVQPVLQPPYGVMTFTEEAVYTVRRIERLRSVHRLDVAWIKTIFALLGEVERLRAEVRFLQRQ